MHTLTFVANLKTMENHATSVNSDLARILNSMGGGGSGGGGSEGGRPAFSTPSMLSSAVRQIVPPKVLEGRHEDLDGRIEELETSCEQLYQGMANIDRLSRAINSVEGAANRLAADAKTYAQTAINSARRAFATTSAEISVYDKPKGAVLATLEEGERVCVLDNYVTHGGSTYVEVEMIDSTTGRRQGGVVSTKTHDGLVTFTDYAFSL